MSEETKIEAEVEVPEVEVAAKATVEKSDLTDRDAILELLQKEDAEALREAQLKEDGIDKEALHAELEAEKKPEPAKEEAKTSTPEELAAERKKLEEDRAAFERQRQEFDAKAAAAKKEVADAEKQADQLDEFAKEWEADGQKDLAANARARAAKIRNDVAATKLEAQRAEFRQRQNAVLGEVLKEFPDLGKPESSMFKQMDALLKSRPHLLSQPEGLRDAAQFVSAMQAKAQFESIRQENETLKAQLADMQRKLKPATGKPTATRGGETTFEKLTPDQQRAKLLRAMQLADVAS